MVSNPKDRIERLYDNGNSSFTRGVDVLVRTRAINVESSATVPLLSPNYLKGQLSEISAMTIY